MSAVGNPVSTPADTTAADTTAADSTAADSTAAASTAADSVAAIAHRYPHAFASNGAPLWRAGGMVSTPREAELLRTVASALPLLLALWWVALSLRSLAVDRRRRGSLIVLLGVLGAFGWAVVGPWAIVWATAGLDDRYGTGPALLAALAAACLSALVMSWAIANPRVTIAGILSLPAPVIIGTELATTPTIPDRLRPRLLALCRCTLAGVVLALLCVAVSYGMLFDAVNPGFVQWLALGVAACGVAAGLAALMRTPS